MRGLHRRLPGVTLLVVAAALVLPPAAALGGKPAKAPRATVNFVKVATHPQAIAQPTSRGKTITTLKPWNGQLYSGYGDYGANTGPIAVTPFDGARFAPTPELAAADTEAIYLYREVGGKLYAPSIDPRAGSDFAMATAGSPASWVNPTPIGTTHAFDTVTLTGGDLWLVGSSGNDAVAWRSLDGGTTWTEQLRVPAANTTSGNFARFYGAAVHGGKLYVQAHDYYGGAHSRSKVFDGSGWSDGPSLGLFTHAEPFAGKLLYHGAAHSGSGQGPLQVFDGTQSTSAYGLWVWDYTIDGGTVYVLGVDGKVMASRDLATWSHVGTAPSVARSIGVMNGTLYVGGTDSAIYKK